MTELDEETLSDIRDLQRSAQEAERQMQLYLQGVMRAHGHDPGDAQLDLQEGVIREGEN